MTRVVAPATADATTLDRHIQDIMRWHFSPETGAPYWIERADSLPFDPLRDITGWADLARFPDVSAEWRDIPADALIPRGARDSDYPFLVFDSGGTTGRPKRVVEATSRRDGVHWVSTVLDQHGVPGPGGGGWLHIGPAGPHIVGRSVGLLAQLRGELCHYIDFDPRWVKRLIRDRDLDSVVRYVNHVVDQAVDVLRSQRIAVVFVTPKVLEAICARPDAYDLLVSRAKAIIWAGTSLSPETQHLLETELFPDTVIAGLYGNTLMGICPQRPRVDNDPLPCVFQAYASALRVELVDPDEPSRTVAYGERGQVRFTLLSRDLFVPNCLERDTAVRIPPVDGFDGDGIADVRPLGGTEADGAVGVY